MGIAERKERERQQRRAKIVDAAETVFFKDGFENASMESVAKEAELSKATVYLYFASKDELYFAIFRRAQKLLSGMIDEVLRQPDDARQKLEKSLRTLVRFQKNHTHYFEAIFYFQTHHIQLDGESELVCKGREEARKNIQKWIELVDQAKTDGIFRTGIDSVQLVVLLWIQLSSFIKVFSVSQPNLKMLFNISEEQLVNSYIDIIFNGLTR